MKIIFICTFNNIEIGRDALFRLDHMFQIGRCIQFEKFIPFDVRKDNDLISGIFDSLSMQTKRSFMKRKKE